MWRPVAVVLCLALPGCVAANVDVSPRPEARPEGAREVAQTGSFADWMRSEEHTSDLQSDVCSSDLSSTTCCSFPMPARGRPRR